MTAPAAATKPRLLTVNRNQLIMRTFDVEELVPSDHPARAIWEFVGTLDLSLYYDAIASREGGAGRPAWDPYMLVSLWIYAIKDGVGCAREIERLCEHDPAYQWITGMETVNHHTLSDFRMSNKEALERLFIEILGILSAEGLITLERVAHDGTKIRASAGADSFRSEDRIKEHLEVARQQVAAMGDPRTAEEVGPRVAKARMRAATERVGRLEKAVVELEKIRATRRGEERKDKARVSETDPESRIMKTSDGGYAPCYNAQISTDSAQGVIVAAGISQASNDKQELIPAVESIEKNMEEKPDEIVVDGGYTSRENIIAMAEAKIGMVGSIGDGKAQSVGQLERRGVAPEYRPEKFSYDPEKNSFQCPMGCALNLAGTEERPGCKCHHYRARVEDCLACPVKMLCSPRTENFGRMITRTVEDSKVVDFRKKMETDAAKSAYKTRGPLAEFSNLWLKSKNNLTQFHVRGVEKVNMELQWCSLVRNIQIWILKRWKTGLAAVGT